MQVNRIVIFMIFLLCCFSLYGQVPQLVNYQGKLTGKDGMALTGIFTIKFSIYPDSTGGAALWDETQDVNVMNGIFNVLLGSVRQFPNTLFSSSEKRYLGIKVGTDPEMKPRFLLTSVPFAFQAMYPNIQGGVWDAGNIPYEGVSGGREKTCEINLTGFSKPPTVISFLQKIDANTSNIYLRIITGGRNVEKEKFTLLVGTWADTHIYGVRVGWIAFGY